MKKPFQNLSFKISFWCSIIIFVILNILPHRSYDFVTTITDRGFPFSMFREVISGSSINYIIWSGLIANFVTTVMCSVVVGLTTSYFWSKFFSIRLK